MRIVIAPNALKGCLTARQAALAMRKGVLRVHPRARTSLVPIADGGDGLIDAVLAARGGRLVSVWITGPLGERRRAAFGLCDGGREAVIEMARASGLALNGARRDPMGATSYGTGELIAAALRRGARTILVGLGGSATNDGGAGMAQALGARLLDARGEELPRGAGALARLARVDVSAARRALAAARVVGLADVDNPLLGPRGSARVFGPQKGATPRMVARIERGLARLAKVLKRDVGAEVASLPGGGAAGGLGAGLVGFLRGRIVPGAETVFARISLSERLRGADAVLTAEGWADRTSLGGKAPVALGRLARALKIPAALVCAGAEPGLAPELSQRGIAELATFSEVGATAGDSYSSARRWLAGAAALAARRLALAAALCAVGAAYARAAAPVEEIDRLYWHRNEGRNLDESVERLQKMAAENPQDPAVLWRLGRSLVRQSEKKASSREKLAGFLLAEDKLRASIAIKGDDPESHFWLGLAMGRRGETQGILRSLFLIGPLKKEMRRVIELDPTYGGAHHVLGEIYRQVPRFAGGNKKEAVRELELSVSLDPKRTVHYPALAQAYLAVGEKDKAIEALRKALAITDPADPAEYEDDLKDAREMLASLEKN